MANDQQERRSGMRKRLVLWLFSPIFGMGMVGVAVLVANQELSDIASYEDALRDLLLCAITTSSLTVLEGFECALKRAKTNADDLEAELLTYALILNVLLLITSSVCFALAANLCGNGGCVTLQKLTAVILLCVVALAFGLIFQVQLLRMSR